MSRRKNLSAHTPSACWKEWNLQDTINHSRQKSHISSVRFEDIKGYNILQHDAIPNNQVKVNSNISSFDAHKMSMLHTPEKPLVKRKDPNIPSTASSSNEEQFRSGRKLSNMSSVMVYGTGNDNKTTPRSLELKHRKPITASKIQLSGCYLLLDDPETKIRKKMISVDYSGTQQQKTGPKTVNVPLYRSNSFRMKEEYIGVMFI